MFFGSNPYKGSNLERSILGRIDEIASSSNDDLARFMQALMREHPQFYKSLFSGSSPIPDLSIDDPNTRELYVALAYGTALVISLLIVSSFVAARDYGMGLDQLRSSDGVAALAVASCLVQFVHAANVPRDKTSGGYFRYFSAYLILRQSLALFNFAGPWENYIKGMKAPDGFAGLDLGRWFGSDFTGILSGLTPRAEQNTRLQILQQLEGFRLGIGLIPGPAATIALNQIFDLPQASFSVPWTLPEIGVGTFDTFPRTGSGGGQASPATLEARQILINAGVRLPL
jgi:hypothetical protein